MVESPALRADLGPSRPVVLAWGDSARRGPLATSRDIFGCHSLGVMLLASSERRPEVLLKALQCTEQSPPRVIQPQMSAVRG